MESELTAAEKATIVEKFVRCTPSGELEPVIADLNCLLDTDRNSELYRVAIGQSSHSYRRDQLCPVAVPGSEQKCLISTYNCLENDRYYDPRTKQSFSFDPLSGKASDFRDEKESRLAVEHSGSLQPSLDSAVVSYVKTRYPNGNSSVYVIEQRFLTLMQKQIGSSGGGRRGNQVDPNDEGLLDATSLEYLLRTTSNRKFGPLYAICIECHEYQWQNFWTGSWRSQWIVSLINQAQCTLLGLAKIQVHYYEDSNIQLRGRKKFNVDVNSSGGDLATEIVKVIASAEDGYQLSINKCQANMSEQIFKSLRRQLPVTKSKINWDVMVSYRDMRELNSSDQHNDSRASS